MKRHCLNLLYGEIMIWLRICNIYEKSHVSYSWKYEVSLLFLLLFFQVAYTEAWQANKESFECDVSFIRTEYKREKINYFFLKLCEKDSLRRWEIWGRGKGGFWLNPLCSRILCCTDMVGVWAGEGKRWSLTREAWAYCGWGVGRGVWAAGII